MEDKKEIRMTLAQLEMLSRAGNRMGGYGWERIMN